MATHPRTPRALKWTGIVAGALVLTVALVLVILENADLRGSVSRMIAERTGQPIRIAGALDLRLFSLTPGAVVTGLELGNPKWVGAGSMARVDRLTVEVKLLSLLKGEIVLPRLLIDRPDVQLIRNAAGRANWRERKGGERQGRAPVLPVVHKLVVNDGRVKLVDEIRKLTFTGSIEARETPSSTNASPMRLESHGELNGEPFHLELRGGALVNVRRDEPYPFEYEVIAGDTRMAARGAIARPSTSAPTRPISAFRARMWPICITSPAWRCRILLLIKVSGHVHRAGSRLYLHAFRGLVGDSDIDAEATVEMARERPMIEADVVSRSLDLDDLGVPLGAAPSINAEAQAMKAKRRIFPDSKLQAHRLRAMDAEVQFHADAVEARKVPLREVSLQLRLEDGILTLDPVSFVLPQGKLSATVRVDARQDLPVTTLDARLTGLELGQFRPRNARQAPLEGTLLGRAQLKGYGSSIHEVVSTADGTLTVVLPHGQVREVFAELTGINVARGLGLLMRDDEGQTGVRCGVADFAVKHGTLQAKNIVFDTDHVLISGRGEIDLDAEAFDLSITGQPKELRLFRVRSPMGVRGPLRKPDIGLESGDSPVQTGVAAALAAAVAPLAAVLAFVDPGLAEDANCAALLAEARRDGAPVKSADVNKARRG